MFIVVASCRRLLRIFIAIRRRDVHRHHRTATEQAIQGMMITLQKHSLLIFVDLQEIDCVFISLCRTLVPSSTVAKAFKKLNCVRHFDPLFC